MKEYTYHLKESMLTFFINFVNDVNPKDKIKIKNIYKIKLTQQKTLRTKLKLKINVKKLLFAKTYSKKYTSDQKSINHII